MKIFGIGLSKTGTTSLNRALEILGCSSVHCPLIPGQIEAHDAATDISIAAQFERLDTEYPGSKFIYTVRDLDDWLDSCRHHWAYHRRKFAQNKDLQRLHLSLYSSLTYDRDAFERGYMRHDARVRAYFSGRELLVMDIRGGDGWDKLCPFLDCSKPPEPFPHANVARPMIHRYLSPTRRLVKLVRNPKKLARKIILGY